MGGIEVFFGGDPKPQDDNLGTRLVIGVIVLLGGLVLAALAIMLWDQDMPVLLRVYLVAMPVMAIGMAISQLRRIND